MWQINEFIGCYSPKDQMFCCQKFNSVEDAKNVARTVYRLSSHLRGEDGDIYNVEVAIYDSDGFPEDVLFMITKEGETTDPGTIKIWNNEFLESEMLFNGTSRLIE